MRRSSVLLNSIAFWSVGSFVCLALSLNNLLVKSTADHFAGENAKWPWARWASLGGGVLLGVLQASVLVPFARRDAVRILSLPRPHCMDFFPRRALLIVLVVAGT